MLGTWKARPSGSPLRRCLLLGHRTSLPQALINHPELQWVARKYNVG